METYKGFKIERFEVGSTTKKFNYKCGKLRAPRKKDIKAEIDRLEFDAGYIGADIIPKPIITKTMEQDEIIIIPIAFKKTWSPKKDGAQKAKLRMKMIDCIGKITDDDKNEVGSVAGTIGAGYELSFRANKDFDLYADPKVFWNAYCDAMLKPELKIDWLWR